MSRHRTTAALPFAHLSLATSTLRAELGRQLNGGDAHGPDWATLRIVGPFEVFTAAGTVTYEYRGSVEPRRLDALPNARPARAGVGGTR